MQLVPRPMTTILRIVTKRLWSHRWLALSQMVGLLAALALTINDTVT